MERSPRVAFGLFAATIALKAKSGRITLRDQLDFAVNALEWAMGSVPARDATLAFLAAVRSDPVAAGADLQAFLSDWISDIDPQAPERTLQRIAEEAQVEFDWQKRADLQ